MGVGVGAGAVAVGVGAGAVAVGVGAGAVAVGVGAGVVAVGVGAVADAVGVGVDDDEQAASQIAPIASASIARLERRNDVMRIWRFLSISTCFLVNA